MSRIINYRAKFDGQAGEKKIGRINKLYRKGQTGRSFECAGSGA